MSESNDWRIAWSHQIDGRTTAMVADGDGIVIATGPEVRSIDSSGDFRWRRSFVFDVFDLRIDDGSLAVLCGTGFHVLDRTTGVPLCEGRATAGGFRRATARPGGGWVLADRGDHLHLFHRDGRGIRRVRSGPTRKLLGWLDREHLIALDHDGRLRCIRLHGEDAQRIIEDRRWTWASSLHRGRLLLQALDGSLHDGAPNPFGWDSIDRVSDLGEDPIAAILSADGWWLLGMDGRTVGISSGLIEGLVVGSDEWLSGNGYDILATASRDGLVRWIESPSLGGRRAAAIRGFVADERRRLDWLQRESVFEAARQAENQGMWTRGIELYRSLGRDDDVRRLLAAREATD